VWFAKNIVGDVVRAAPLAQVSRELAPMQQEIDRLTRMLNARDNRFAYCFCEIK